MTLCNPMDYHPPGFSVHGILQQDYHSGLSFPSPGDFHTQGWNPDLLHCRQILYHLSPWICHNQRTKSYTIFPTLLSVHQIELKKNNFKECTHWTIKFEVKQLLTFKTSQILSVQFSHSVVSDFLWPHELQHARPPCPSPTPGVHPNPCPLSRWSHPTISSSVIPFSSCSQSFPASGSFQMSQLFASGGQSISISAWASVLPMNIQDWFPLGWTGWISLQSKELSRVFSNTTVQKHQFFGAQISL